MGTNINVFTGRLGKDPELRFTQSGRAVCNLSIAVNDHFKNAEGEAQEHTTWIPVVCWQKLAENCEKYLKKGSHVAVTGQNRGRMWETDEGAKRYVLEVRASNVQFLDPPPKNNRSQEDAIPEEEMGEPASIPNDDIPF